VSNIYRSLFMQARCASKKALLEHLTHARHATLSFYAEDGGPWADSIHLRMLSEYVASTG